MRDFFETKPFGAAMVGVVTLAIGFVAGLSGSTLLSAPIVVMAAYWFIIIDDEAK
jgi:hypothetical protein